MTEALPPVEEVLREPGMTFDQAQAALLSAGYSAFYAKHFAALATGRSDGDVKRPRTSHRVKSR